MRLACDRSAQKVHLTNFWSYPTFLSGAWLKSPENSLLVQPGPDALACTPALSLAPRGGPAWVSLDFLIKFLKNKYFLLKVEVCLPCLSSCRSAKKMPGPFFIF
jgi:hypothetical protein